jgi:hypothetical protein
MAGRFDDQVDPALIERQAARLNRLADRLVAAETAGKGEQTAFTALSEQCERCLAAGGEEAVERALAAADPDALQALKDAVELCIEEQVLADAGGNPVYATLFAVPLLLTLGTTVEQVEPLELPDIQPLAASLRQHGLIGVKPDLFMVNRFYSAQELMAAGLNRCYRWLGQLLENHSGRQLILCDERLPRALPAREAHLQLRFLIGAALQREDEPLPFLDGDDDRLEARLSRWSETFAHLLEEQLAEVGWQSAILALEPDGFHEAVRSGVTAYEEFAFTTALAVALREMDTGCLVERVLYEERGSITVTARDSINHEPLWRYVYTLHPWDDPEERLNTLDEELARYGAAVDQEAPPPFPPDGGRLH